MLLSVVDELFVWLVSFQEVLVLCVQCEENAMNKIDCELSIIPKVKNILSSAHRPANM